MSKMPSLDELDNLVLDPAIQGGGAGRLRREPVVLHHQQQAGGQQGFHPKRQGGRVFLCAKHSGG